MRENKNKNYPLKTRWIGNGEKMEEKMNKDLFRIGTKHVDHWDLKTYEAISMGVVGVLSVALGQIYGSLLF